METSRVPRGRVMYSSGSDLDSDSESMSGQMATLVGEADPSEVSEFEDGSSDCALEPESRNNSILKPKCRCCQYENYLEKQCQRCGNSTVISGGNSKRETCGEHRMSLPINVVGDAPSTNNIDNERFLSPRDLNDKGSGKMQNSGKFHHWGVEWTH